MQQVLELVAALSVHDRQTRGHSERVRVFADLIADEMHLSDADRARLRWASLLHDIGKLVVPPEILTKPAALTDVEMSAVRRHPEEGERLIGPLRAWLGEWGEAVVQHHERYDGTGYPHGLAGDQISLAGRIVAVADSYEVMTAARPYRKSISVSAARKELVKCSGTQFDPMVVRAFLNISMGRLWRVVGFGSWVAQLSLLGWIQTLGLELGRRGHRVRHHGDRGRGPRDRAASHAAADRDHAASRAHRQRTVTLHAEANQHGQQSRRVEPRRLGRWFARLRHPAAVTNRPSVANADGVHHRPHRHRRPVLIRPRWFLSKAGAST